MSFNDKVVLICGATSGIGKVTALHFSSKGAKLVLVGRNKDHLEAIFAECTVRKPCLILGDVSNPESVKRILDTTILHYKQLDVLVNNSGILEDNGSTDLEQYEKLFEAYVKSTYHLMMLAIPHLKKTNGRIINVSSFPEVMAPSAIFSYYVTKDAINWFANFVVAQLRPKGVKIRNFNIGVLIKDLHNWVGIEQAEYVAKGIMFSAN